ncbi:unnamed protein product [Linum tenue]|uniref:DYW domain-containing protein n=1 Tax=Linum tenue TaxID=586396 RepID=A0AAV0QW84_9ROSI|nr:unnamed protein product [Linum tenue]
MASLPSFPSTTTFQPEPSLLQKLSSTASLPAQKNGSSQSNLFHRNPVTTQLNGASEQKRYIDFREALSLIRRGTKFKSQVYHPLLQHCIDKNSVSEAEILHAHMIKTGTQEQFFLMTALVNVYAKCGDMKSARKVFDNLPRRNVIAWTTLMSGYVQNSRPESAVEVYREMLESGSLPTGHTLGIALNACSALNLLDLGRQFHAFIIKYKIAHDPSVGNALCTFYSKFGCLKSAVETFKGIEEKNVISWTAIITACGDSSDAASGLRFFIEMLKEDVNPNEFTFTAVISLCSVLIALDTGAQVHSLAIKLGYESNIQIINSIMYLYLKSGRIDEAQNFFNRLESVSMVTWNAVIAGHAQAIDVAKDELLAHRSGTEALRNYFHLNRSVLKPDLYTLSSIFTVCGKILAAEQGEQIHAHTIKTGFLSDVVVGTALVNMYSKCGSVERASKAFLEMSTRTLISWTAMISSFAQHGWSNQALQLFEDMRLAGVKPNQITFVGALAACSHARMVNEGLRYFEMMRKEYRIRPLMDHYGCMVDLYVRLGRIDEAFNVVKKMDFPPNEFIWLVLISGCRDQGNEEIGFHAAQQLLKLKPKDPQIYSILLNYYASAKSWEDVSRLKELMKEEKIGILEDWSWISIKDKVHSFKTSIQRAPGNAGTFRLLDELLDKARSHGYMTHAAMEVNNEVREIEMEHGHYSSASAANHSERLAVAFGLLNIQTDAPIRVNKNTRMCRDCHSFIKIVSSMSSREIIVKDSWRIHRFANGQCSCGEFCGLV